MVETVLLPWVHYLAVLMMAGAAVAELYLLKLAAEVAAIRLLPRIDRFYGIAAGLVFVTGILRMYFGGKGADWYWSNGLMHATIGVFLLAAGISLAPTIRYLRWRDLLESGGARPTPDEVRRMTLLVHVQLMLVAIVALLITLVAKGYGA